MDDFFCVVNNKPLGLVYGIVDELKQHLAKVGSRGGKSKSAKKIDAARRNILLAQQARKKKKS